jgi:hypothetical protein
VKSIDGSSDCGHVPDTTVATPPDAPDPPAELDELPLDPDDDAAVDDVKLELPHAATAHAMATAMAVHSGLLCFLMHPPPRGSSALSIHSTSMAALSHCWATLASPDAVNRALGGERAGASSKRARHRCAAKRREATRVYANGIHRDSSE